jgi:hypothetical protein
MKIEYVKGDLFDMVEQGAVIPHVCNCDNKWGRGFVVPLIKHYHQSRHMFNEWWCGRLEGMPECILGRTQVVEVDRDIFVANMVAQVFYCREGMRSTRPLYYNALVTCMETVARFLLNHDTDATHILAPKFGSELAGGNWDFVEDLIYDIWIEKGIPVKVVVYEDRTSRLR